MNVFRRRLGHIPILNIITRANRPHWQPLAFHRHGRFNSTNSRPTTEPSTESARSFESPKLVLRDYQEECIQSVLRYLDEGQKRLGISLATGAGKTVIFTELIGRIPSRNEIGDKTLIIVHRKELVEQAAQHCRRAYPDRTVEIEMGHSHASGAGDIIVASVQTLTRGNRLAKFDPRRFKLVLVDEAHHIVASSYRGILKHFGADEASTDSPVLVGVSATFSRSDGLKLGAAIDHIVYHKDYIDMIDDNWLANAVFTTVRSEANLSKVKKDSFGDFAIGSLSKAVNTENVNNITVRAWLANAQDRKSTLVFCVDVAHTKALTETFRNYGIDARYITAKTPKDVRMEQLRAFRNREYPVLMNCGLFTEGTDIPNIDCVLLARPTRSRNLLIQMIGRGLRLYPGKEDCHIIDMVATLNTGVLSTPTLFGLHPDEILQKAKAKDLRDVPLENTATGNATTPAEEETEEPAPFPDDSDINLTFTKYDTIYDLIADLKSEKHIRSLSPHVWVRVGDDRYILSDASGWLTIDKEEDTGRAYRPQPNPDPTSTANTPDDPYIYTVRHVAKFKNSDDSVTHTRPRLIATAPDFETALRAADTFATSEFEERYISVFQTWRQLPATEAQVRFLNKSKVRHGLINRKHLTRGQAADLITKLKFGGKQRFAARRAERLAELRRQEEVEELRKQGDVRVGPVES
ncbi:putative mitochondrial ATP-dependent helicase irc3 [Aspergillus lentulus]|nr:putative mitochondrial ATP-dependent helicase irc3 [Aspergillus lentulus]